MVGAGPGASIRVASEVIEVGPGIGAAVGECDCGWADGDALGAVGIVEGGRDRSDQRGLGGGGGVDGLESVHTKW